MFRLRQGIFTTFLVHILATFANRVGYVTAQEDIGIVKLLCDKFNTELCTIKIRPMVFLSEETILAGSQLTRFLL